MSATVRSHTTAFTVGSSTSTTSPSISRPSGTTDGDLLFLHVMTFANGGEIYTQPSGFGVIDGGSFVNDDPIIVGLNALYMKTASGEPSSYTVTASVAPYWVLGLTCVTGVDQTTPVNTYAKTTETGTISIYTTPTVTTSVDKCLILQFIADGSTIDNTTDNFSFPPNTTQIYQAGKAESGKGSGALAMGRDTSAKSPAGTTASRTITLSGDSRNGAMVYTVAVAGAPPNDPVRIVRQSIARSANF